MKRFFNDLFAIFTQNELMSKHSKIMFVSTILLCVLLKIIMPMWISLLLTIFLMVLYEIAFAFIPIHEIKILFFKIKFFNFVAWQNDLIDNILDQHNDIVKYDFYNIFSGIIIFIVFYYLTCLI